MKNKIWVVVGILVLATLVGVGIFLFTRPKAETSEVRAVGYITYYDNYDPTLQKELPSAAQSAGYDYLFYDCNRSSASAQAHATSAINSKVKTVLIDYPEHDVAERVADSLQQAGITPVIVGGGSPTHANLALDVDKVRKEMVDVVGKNVSDADLLVGLHAQDKPDWSKTLVMDTTRLLADQQNVEADYVVTSTLLDQAVGARDYLHDLLTVSHDRQAVLLVCDSADLAAGLQQAVQELGKENAVTIFCYDGDNAILSGRVPTYVLKRKDQNLSNLIKHPKSQSIPFSIQRIE